MALSAPIGAAASSVPVSSYRHTNWRMSGPPPLIVNPEADLHALMAFAWGETADIEDVVSAFVSDNESTAQDLASILYGRVSPLVAVLEFLADKALKGEIK